MSIVTSFLCLSGSDPSPETRRLENLEAVYLLGPEFLCHFLFQLIILGCLEQIGLIKFSPGIFVNV